MKRSVRRLLTVLGVAALASTAFVGAASAPAPAAAEAFGYTVQLRFPAGVGVQCRPATIDLTTGEVTPIGDWQPAATLACAVDLALSPSGALYGIVDEEQFQTGEVDPAAPVQQVHLVQFDTTTGEVTDLGAIGPNDSTLTGRAGNGGITFDAAGRLLVEMVGNEPACDDLDAMCLYQVDPADPSNATLIGGASSDNFLFGLTATCSGALYAVEDTLFDEGADAADDVRNPGGGNQLDTVDGATGATAAVGGLTPEGELIQSLDFTSTGALVGLGGQQPNGLTTIAHLYAIDPATGTATQGVALDSTDEFTFVMGLAIAPLSCAAAPVDIQPNFTG